ncbi:MAG: hypothetical protein AAGB12_05225 [Pseudomonadota bacterium]
MKIKFTVLLLAGCLQSALANNVSKVSTITEMYTYGNVSGISGDLVIKIASPPTGCEAGFYVPAADLENNKNISAILLSAFHSNANVYFAGNTTQIWSGSTTNYCKAHTVGLQK